MYVSIVVPVRSAREQVPTKDTVHKAIEVLMGEHRLIEQALGFLETYAVEIRAGVPALREVIGDYVSATNLMRTDGTSGVVRPSAFGPRSCARAASAGMSVLLA